MSYNSPQFSKPDNIFLQILSRFSLLRSVTSVYSFTPAIEKIQNYSTMSKFDMPDRYKGNDKSIW